LQQDVPTLLREHNWQEAQARVQRARVRYPSVTVWEALLNQIEQARAKFEQHDVETAEREVNDLVALSAWDRALNVVREVQRRHPDSERAAVLARRVQEGVDRAAAEERGRLMKEAQAATDKHEWVVALRLVERVMEKYPTSPEAHDLRLQLPTLKVNVEIQTRQRTESEIRLLVKQHRYVEAVRMAQDLIEQYPGSPQAKVLQSQLPKLQEMAQRGR
jgi:outer membrane protein assembly factor BamD (BamD/ComL family)